ncbi:MAG: hypothetical protein LAO51_14670 [Acidobacteriia bacterium]|nr:hypothetical protein [Terriglobia bacterium]
MNAGCRAIRGALLLTCAFLLVLLASPGAGAQEYDVAAGTATGVRVATARFSAIGDDPDPVPGGRFHLNLNLSERFALDAIAAVTSYVGAAWPGVPGVDALSLLAQTTAAGERTVSRLDARGRSAPVGPGKVGRR